MANYDRYSYFIKDKALFGGFPNQDQVKILEDEGIRLFVDLTTEEERDETTPYKTMYGYIKYPIPDRRIPTNWATFSALVVKVTTTIKNLQTGEKVYIHCKGGHGRSGILVACLLCYIHKLSPGMSLYLTNYYHLKRPGMSEKSRKLGSPQGKSQKNFVYKLFKELFYGNITYMNEYNKGFCDFSAHPVSIHGIGTYANAYEAFLELKKHRSGVGDEECMEEILRLKFTQHADLRSMLLNTGFRPLIKVGAWGDVHGKILEKIRAMFLAEEI